MQNHLCMEIFGHRRKLAVTIKRWLTEGPPDGSVSHVATPRRSSGSNPGSAETSASPPAPTPELCPPPAPRAGSMQHKVISIIWVATSTRVGFKVKDSTLLGCVFRAFCMKLELEVDYTKIRFVFGEERASHTLRVHDLGMEDGDCIYAMLEQVGGKPVILLYPRSQTLCTVNLALSKRWSLSCLYPQPASGAVGSLASSW